MEQIQFRLFTFKIICYIILSITKKTARSYMEIWHRGSWFKLHPQLPVCFGFTIASKKILQSKAFTIIVNQDQLEANE